MKISAIACTPLPTPPIPSQTLVVNEYPKVDQPTIQKAVPPPLSQKRRSALDEIENTEVSDKKEPKSNKAKRKSDKEMDAGN